MLLAAGAAGWFYVQLRASLPQLDGAAALPGLAAPVAVTRDALGMVTIQAASRVDAARALGYLHAQDRFFQMDLLRRKGAGELVIVAGDRTPARNRSSASVVPMPCCSGRRCASASAGKTRTS